MYQGRNSLSLDVKGRIAIPTRHRDVLIEQAGGCLTLTRHPDGCLLMYTRPTWEKKREELAQLPASYRRLQRLILGSAQDVEMDASGRILIAPELRELANLSRDLMLVGAGNYFEIWDAQALRDSENELISAADLDQMLDGFSF